MLKGENLKELQNKLGGNYKVESFSTEAYNYNIKITHKYFRIILIENIKSRDDINIQFSRTCIINYKELFNILEIIIKYFNL